jgi:MoxR-like ATPase
VSKTKDGEGIRLGFRKKGKRGSKSFEILRLGDLSGSKGEGGGNNIQLKYTGKTFSQNVLEVWFPQRKEEEASILQVPIDLDMYEEEGGVEKYKFDDYWAEFSEEGLNVRVPEVTAAREENEEGFAIKTTGESDSYRSWMRVGLSCLVYWTLCNIYDGDGALREEGGIPDGFPELEEYRAKRPVNLDPATVIDKLESEEREDKLYFPWHVIESACSALNAGKNVIFTGPPGCGKSKLASFLAKRATGQEPLMTTASPAWSTGDLIGRYMPAREGHGLVFQEGVFLRALGDTDERSRWLVIDEFNRADIDSCFGELFSVLAGDVAELPFEKENESEEDRPEGETNEAHPVRIVPEGEEDGEKDADYIVPDKFRLIGTMNDADRSGLNDLSFALMRRFAIIHVESPKESDINDIISNEINKTSKDLNLEKNAWDVNKKVTTRCSLELIEDELKNLFTPRKSGSTDGEIEDLITDSVVGVSVIGDIIRFVGEGIRTEEKDKPLDRSDDLEDDAPWDDMDDLAEKLTLSYLALATVLQIFPQLEALEMGTQQDQNKLFQAVLHIFEAFHKDHEDELVMLRVKREDGSYTLESEEMIGDFLFRNLKTRFPRQAGSWKEDLSQYLPDENTNEGESA